MNRTNAQHAAGNAEQLLACANRDRNRPCNCKEPFRIIDGGLLHYGMDDWRGPWNPVEGCANRGNHDGMRSVWVRARIECTGCHMQTRFGLEMEASLELLETELMSPREEWTVKGEGPIIEQFKTAMRKAAMRWRRLKAKGHELQASCVLEDAKHFAITVKHLRDLRKQFLSN